MLRTVGLQIICGRAGLTDKGKELLIVGKNEKTVLVYNAVGTAGRDGNAIKIGNANTVMRNFTFVFTPKYSGEATYSNAIFSCLSDDLEEAVVENVLFRIISSNKASWKYGDSIDVINCTFYHETNMVNASYSNGLTKFYNIATNVGIDGNNTNIITEDFGTAEMSLEDLIQASRKNVAFRENQVGVFYGEYAWK